MMTPADDQLRAVLTRAAGNSPLPPGFGATVVSRARRRRFRNVGAVITVAAGVVALTVLGTPRLGLLGETSDGRTPATSTGEPTDAAIDAPTRDPVLLDSLSVSTGRTIRSADVLVVGPAGDATVVMVTREANPAEAAIGGKAVSVWSVTRDGRAYPVADYYGYDSACLSEDRVCAEIQRSGVGLAAVIVNKGTAYVFVARTGHQPVTVRTPEGGVTSFTPGRGGGTVAVQTTRPGEIVVRPRLDDGRSYTIPLTVGAIMHL